MMSKNLVLLKGNCLELMEKIPDRSIDCDRPTV